MKYIIPVLLLSALLLMGCIGSQHTSEKNTKDMDVQEEKEHKSIIEKVLPPDKESENPVDELMDIVDPSREVLEFNGRTEVEEEFSAEVRDGSLIVSSPVFREVDISKTIVKGCGEREFSVSGDRLSVDLSGCEPKDYYDLTVSAFLHERTDEINHVFPFCTAQTMPGLAMCSMNVKISVE